MAGTLHVTFSEPAAETLRATLAAAGRHGEAVAALPDALSVGPIDPPDPARRADWMRQVLDADTYWPPEVVAAFWRRVAGGRERIVAWVAPRWVDDWCGLLALDQALAGTGYHTIDFERDRAVLRRPDGRVPRLALSSFAMLNVGELGRFLDCAAAVSPADRDRFCRHWATLQAENAPLRVLAGNTVISAPLSHFDTDIVAAADRTWRSTAWFLGTLLGRVLDNLELQGGELLLTARIRALVAEGRLEARGDLSDIRHSEVRRAAAP